MNRRRLWILVLFAACVLPLATCGSARAAALSYDNMGDSTLVVKPDGSLWAWGGNAYGQLGRGDFFTREPADWCPARIGTENTWVQVASDGDHDLAIKTDGSLWVWGWNMDGELGLGDTTDRPSPTRLGTAIWQKVDAGLGFSAGIQADGSLWTWGLGTRGAIGNGATGDQVTPYHIMPGTTFTDVRCGMLSIWAVDSTGHVWEWGCGSQGLLGLGSTSDQLAPAATPFTTALWSQISLGYSTSAGVKADGTLWTWGGDIGVTPVQFGAGTTWDDVVVGEGHDLALADGQLWAWGDNEWGQLGIGSHTSQAAPVRIGVDTTWLSARAGDADSIAEKSNGTLWGWGLNSYGSLGDCTDRMRSRPVVVFDALDVTSPKCSAPSAASVHKGATAIIKYKVTDAPSTTNLVTSWITIKKAGLVVKTIQTGRQKPGVARTCTFHCTLPKGKYRFLVTAIDVGGNRQSVAGANWLTVH